LESITKRKLKLEEIKKLVKCAFGEDKIEYLEEMEEGYFNAIYYIRLSQGREVILKVAPSKEVLLLTYEKDIMRAEVEVLRLIKAKSSVPVPRVYFYDNSGSIIENEYYFMEKIIGEPYSKAVDTHTEEEKNKIEESIGRYNSLINDIKCDTFGYYAQQDKQRDNWADAFLIMIKDILEDGSHFDIPLPLPYDEIYELILDNASYLKEVKTASLVHWDLHPGNIFIDEKNQISGIIDCERALWGDPLMEVYFSNMFNPNNFSKGYSKEMLKTKAEKCRRTMYNIYLYLVMVIECTYRQYKSNDQEKWTFDLLTKEINSLKAIN